MGDGRGDTSAAEPRIQWQQGACCISFVRRTVELPRAAPGRLAGSRVRRAELKSTSPPWVQRPAEDVPDEGAEQDEHVPVQTQLQIVSSVHQNFVRIGYHGFEGRVEDNSM